MKENFKIEPGLGLSLIHKIILNNPNNSLDSNNSSLNKCITKTLKMIFLKQFSQLSIKILNYNEILQFLSNFQSI